MQIEMINQYETEAHILCNILEDEFKSNNIKVRSLNDIKKLEMTGHELLKISRIFYEKATYIENQMHKCESIG